MNGSIRYQKVDLHRCNSKKESENAALSEPKSTMTAAQKENGFCGLSRIKSTRG